MGLLYRGSLHWGFTVMQNVKTFETKNVIMLLMQHVHVIALDAKMYYQKLMESVMGQNVIYNILRGIFSSYNS